MPNWCMNTVYVTGPASEAKAVRTLMTTTRSKFDFNAVIPMPQELRLSEASSNADDAWELKYGDWLQVPGKYGPRNFDSRDAALAAARQADDWRPRVWPSRENPFPVIPPRSFDDLADHVQELVIKYGHRDWYSWACENWGTKWSAIRAGWMSPSRAAKRAAEQVAYFDTAWCPPMPLMVVMSARFPAVIIRIEYCVQQNFFGFAAIQAGEIIASKSEEYDYRDPSVSIGLSHDLCRQHSNEGDRESVYIGNERGADDDGPAFARSRWMNPFAITGRERREAVDLYRRWILGDAQAANLLPPGEWSRPSVEDIRDELIGKTLVCNCGHDNPSQGDTCHGHTLMRFACGWDGEVEDCDADERDEDEASPCDLIVGGQVSRDQPGEGTS